MQPGSAACGCFVQVQLEVQRGGAAWGMQPGAAAWRPRSQRMRLPAAGVHFAPEFGRGCPMTKVQDVVRDSGLI